MIDDRINRAAPAAPNQEIQQGGLYVAPETFGNIPQAPALVGAKVPTVASILNPQPQPMDPVLYNNGILPPESFDTGNFFGISPGEQARLQQDLSADWPFALEDPNGSYDLLGEWLQNLEGIPRSRDSPTSGQIPLFGSIEASR